VASAVADVELKSFDNVRAEHDAAQLLDSVNTVIRQVLDGAGESDQIINCGIAVQRSSVIAWDASGAALGNVLGWQDVRGAESLNALEAHATEIRRITGLPLSPYYGASKLHWLLNEMDVSASNHAARRRLSPLASFLLYHLLENRPYVIDHSNAQRTQLFDIHTLDWSTRLAQWFGVPLRFLPACVPLRADYGRLSHGNIPVSVVCGDQNAAMVGAGELHADTVLVNIGSGAFMLRKLRRYSGSEKLLTGIAYSDMDKIEYLREATINGAGSALDWAARQWGIADLHERLPLWLETVHNPPVFINTVGGLGTPWMRGGLEPVLIGESQWTTDAERVVAVIESIVFLIRMNLDQISRESPVTRLRLSGGLSRLDGLCRKLGILTGLPVERSDDTEATARGVAWLAAGQPERWNRAGWMEIFTPKADHGLERRYHVFQAELERLLE
jgi:glycerol kinase